MSKRIAFVVDHPQRDLAGIVLAAYEACQHGATCHLVPLNLQHREVWSLAPDLVVLNYLRRNNQEFGRQLIDAGIAVTAMDTEGGVWPDVDTYLELLWQDADLLRRVDLACMWGPRLASAVVAKGLLTRSQVAVTGCPRFDLYHPLWSPTRGATAAPAERAILINTNFSVSNPRFATVEQNAHHLQEQLGWSRERWQEYVDAEQRAIRLIIALARDLERDYPTAQIVLRPHPFEDLERYRLALRGASRVRIDNEPTVQSEILGASVVIQRSCSTAIEAGLAGVPTLSPQWVPAPWLMPAAESVSEPCLSYQDMREPLDAILAGTYQASPAIETAICDVIREWFHQNDGLAHARVSEAVVGLLNGTRHVDERMCLRQLCGLDASVGLGPRRLAGELRVALGLSPDWSFRQLRHAPNTEWPLTAKHFAAATVAALTRQISEVQVERGRKVRPVMVERAREARDYLRHHQGHAVTMRCTGSAS